MNKEYKIKLKYTAYDSEETSAISLISYEIENARDQKDNKGTVQDVDADVDIAFKSVAHFWLY